MMIFERSESRRGVAVYMFYNFDYFNLSICILFKMLVLKALAYQESNQTDK